MNREEKEEVTFYGEKTGLQQEDSALEPMEPFDPKNIKISQKMISLDQVARRMKSGTIRLSPDFQRNEVWNITKKSQLIESLMLNIPIPMFYVAADENGNWDVVDGLQRFSTIRDFIVDNQSFALQSLEFWKGYNGKKFEDLSPVLYNRILETQLLITIIEQGTPDEVKYNIFKRINTGGMALSSQEIRHALYQGKGTVLLKEFAENNFFKEATDNSINDVRMAAREIILRCVSFMIVGIRGYSNNDNMDTFLRRGLQILNFLESPENLISKRIFTSETKPHFLIKSYDELKRKFELGMQRSFKLFGKNAFRISKQGEKRSPINKGLFDVWGAVLPNIEETKFKKLLDVRDIFIDKYDELKNEVHFYEAVSRTAWQKNNVEYRFSKIRELIEEFAV